jgi:hypothetical protein
MARQVDDETVLLDLATGTYFGLDPVGGRAWSLLGSGKCLAEVCDVLIEEFEVTRDVLERDVVALVEQLLERKLVTVA